MTRATFFKHFELLADQPDAVAKMRELLLQLAVRGKVVAQNPKDESAEVLIAKVRSAKERLTKELRIRELASDLPIKDEDKKRPLPRGWAWVKLADLSLKLGAGSTPLGGKQVYEASGIKFLRSQNVYNDGLHLDDVAFIPPAIHKDMSGTWVQPGDILLNITGASIGRSAIVPDDFDEANVNQHVAIVRLAEKALRQFLHLVVIAPDFQQRIMDVQVGVSREGLSMTRLKEFVVAVPPLAEQRRIVAKVDELMALCDELEQRQQARQHASGILQQSALHHLLAAREPQTFAAAWQRVRDHFHLLHDTPDAIPQLRQAILQLAVQGRLVPQNHRDEPVSELLKRVEKERQRIKQAGEHRIPDEFENVAVPEYPWDTPPQWSWCRLAELVLFIDYRGKTPVKTREGVRLLTAKNVRKGYLSLEPREFIAEDSYADWMTRGLPRVGDVLFTTEAPLGNAAVLDLAERVALAQRTINFRLFGGIDPKFMVHCICSPLYQNFLEEHATGMTATGIKSGKLKLLPFPLPPLDEQKRIVGRVEELLRWCDRLEAQLHQARTLGAHLLASTLHHLLAA